eukprot:9312287-Lingulodinium_polyedra.AAC.1
MPRCPPTAAGLCFVAAVTRPCASLHPPSLSPGSLRARPVSSASSSHPGPRASWRLPLPPRVRRR